MNPAKYTALDYINFLIGTQKAYSCLEAARVQPEVCEPPAHDAINRLLNRLEPETKDLWTEGKSWVSLTDGILVIDDTTLDFSWSVGQGRETRPSPDRKWYAAKMELVTRHWSGKHKRVVQGINLTTLLWSDGDKHIPCDYRLYKKSLDGQTKNDHFRGMMAQARERGFCPECVVFDSWFGSLENLKLIRSYNWLGLTRLKRNRYVNPDGTGNCPVSEVVIPPTGTQVHLRGYGFIKVFKIVAPNGDIDDWATNDLNLSELGRLRLAELAWSIEEYHRGLKQCCGVERSPVRSSRGQRNHIGLAIRAFLRLEIH
jgi:putative transposase